MLYRKRITLSRMFAGATGFSGAAINAVLASVLLLSSALSFGQYQPPQNMNPEIPRYPDFDTTQSGEVWLVYTYEIDVEGLVKKLEIHSSNEVVMVNEAIKAHISRMRYQPAMRNGQPVLTYVGPVFFTLILDEERRLSPIFQRYYDVAKQQISTGDYEGAFENAVAMRGMARRNAYEEVKVQLLAAQMAAHWEDDAAELQHLKRAVEFQTLADSKKFTHGYLEATEYLVTLGRIHEVQLSNQMMADAGRILDSMMELDAESMITTGVRFRHEEFQMEVDGSKPLETKAELTPIYRGGPGSWEGWLARPEFGLDKVRGKIESLFLICDSGERRLDYPYQIKWTIPAGMQACKVEITGDSGTRLVFKQFPTVVAPPPGV
ncbi:MAG: hypothetical protein ACJAYC_003823 [Halieaceae bacterium]|jgi:hypothetical protein